MYWLAVLVTVALLLCSIVYTDNLTGHKYTFASLFYDRVAMTALENGEISIYNILLGYDTSYLWMFCPIIVGIACVLTGRTERFVLFRMSKLKYVFTRYISNLVASGFIVVIAYFVYMTLGMVLAGESMWDMYLARKLLSVFVWGIINSIVGLVLMEFVHNKYLILCIPFVINYFMNMFTWDMLPYTLRSVILTSNYQLIFLYDGKTIIYSMIFLGTVIVACGVLKGIVIERRCDCGQQ